MNFSAHRFWRHSAAVLALGLMGSVGHAQETFKIGIVSFLSGQAAESFGIPAVNGAKVLIEAFNKGQAPAPYNKPGIGGMPIEGVYVDEAGGATKQVQELRNLYEREKVDVVVGYVGSGDCLAVAPVAEELKKFLILYDCGTPRIFEDNNFRYVFRTAAHATMDNVALARYLKARKVPVKNFNLINQDYAWGQDSRKDFILSMANLYPDAKSGVDQLPKFGAGQYGTEISALMSKPADLTHSSLWGGDLQAFILQAGPRGLFKKSQVVLSAGDHVLPGLGQKMPDGTILGARGAYGLMAPPSPLNTWWWDTYSKAYNVYPVQAPYH
ncbi:MAG: ABC transporter substrate-binding protein, partial [Limnohabitans sp.]